MNPYASHLGDRDPLLTIEATASRLTALVDRVGHDNWNRPPAEGKWSTHQILCHLTDTEIVFAFRLRQALAEAHHVIQPFDQDMWAGTYAAYDTPAALAVFRAVRGWNISLIRKVTPAELSRPLTHPERGEMTFQVVIETMAGHDLNHIAQIDSILAAK
jgi:uncharacterized damage-inducible protein DinB